MFDFQKFIPITKIDEDEHMVYGWASTPQLDSDGEVIAVEALEKALPKYLQFPTIREMHQPKAVGTTKNAEVSEKGLYIGAKIVAEDAWKLVKEGVYTAFSVGGNIVEKVKNVIHDMELIEISLVDVPANKGAVIELWKSGKVSKNAETVYSLSNLMIQMKDMAMWMDMQGKKKEAKRMGKLMEEIKSLIATEANEPEPNKDEMIMGMEIKDEKVKKYAEALVKIHLFKKGGDISQ